METGGRRKEDAICAGKKRSAKERLGTKNSNYLPRHKVGYGGDGQTQDSNALEDMSIPQPGVARTIPDLSPEVIKNLFPKNASSKDNELGRNLKGQVEHMDEESGIDAILQDSNSPSRYAEVLGEELAARLCEPKTE